MSGLRRNITHPGVCRGGGRQTDGTCGKRHDLLNFGLFNPFTKCFSNPGMHGPLSHRTHGDRQFDQALRLAIERPFGAGLGNPLPRIGQFWIPLYKVMV